MKIIAWNCRGLNDPCSPTIPYLVWLCRTRKPHFLYLSETKMQSNDVVDKLGFLNPSSYFGVDAAGSKGGLAVFAWSGATVNLLYASPNIMVCNVVESNERIRHFVYVYGHPEVEKRQNVWDELSSLIPTYPRCLIIGDFNQIENLEDKMGGSFHIRGIDAFLNWRLNLNISEVPFVGPRFTWSNKRENGNLIMERLDRAYVSNSWFDEFPNGKIIH